ncbi:uncharacterized protein LODBEIA_P52480 [Lodderomyces beijingensis]|uniref:Cytochrome P450 n=1 Tax=Lodderomyces beijingensis TaxID=1775926 RepID=A0ABP0ZSA7_9ASCO
MSQKQSAYPSAPTDLAKTLLAHLLRGACVILITLFLLLVIYELTTRPAEIEGLFSIPGEWPIVGHLYQVLDNPSLVFQVWAQKYHRPIFQIRLGVRRVVVVNSYNEVVNLWINHSCQNNSRPVHYTFHGLVGSFQKLTIGSTPACVSFTKKKKVLSEQLHRRSIESRIPIIDKEANRAIKRLLMDEIGPDRDLYRHLQCFVLGCIVSMGYGIKLDCFGKDRALCDEIISNEADIIRMRSPISNLQDSVPLLRLFPTLTNGIVARRCGARRDVYMNTLHERLLMGMIQGSNECASSIVGTITLEKHLNRLKDQEIGSLCLTLVSAGLDNTSLNLSYLLGVLSQPQLGPRIQSTALAEILSNAKDDVVVAWEQSNQYEMTNLYVTALVLETLRHFTVLPLSLPRATTKPIHHHQKFTLPAQTELLMNAYAANHDCEIFQDAQAFAPERWIDDEKHAIKAVPRTYQHFAFGAGSRMCAGHNLAIREMYMFVVRFLLLFEVGMPTSALMKMDPFENNRNARATSFEPTPHHVELKLRKLPGFEKLHCLVSNE